MPKKQVRVPLLLTTCLLYTSLCGVDFVGVEYGYGDLESMKKEGGMVFAKTTAELLDVLTK